MSRRTASIFTRILEWQAAHPAITWIAWGVVWAFVLMAFLWAKSAGHPIR